MRIFNFENNRELNHENIVVDYAVIGGGLTGVCSAIAAAREGVKVALIQDRPVLGGNASSEVRLWALGATSHMGNNNRWSREGGIIDEILVENTFRNKEGNPVLFDALLIDMVTAEKNITLLLNTAVTDVEKSANNIISSVKAFNPQNETIYKINAKIFGDCSGDGVLAYLCGASFRMGAEDKDEFNEGFALDKEVYGELLGHSIIFYMKDEGKSIKYDAPSFALPLDEIEREIPRLNNPNYLNVAHHGCKYWWLEYGGRLDTISDTEEIKYKLWSVVYGVWNYIKNSGKFPQAKNLTLEWVGLFPGKRESRRFQGYYMLDQNDIINQTSQYDAIAYGGWSIDLHPSDGVFSPMNGCNQWHSKGIYPIPYRCYITPDIENLYIGGRIASTTHVANGSTRVMCTAAYGGQAFGVAAAWCVKQDLKPADFIAKEKIESLQKHLVKQGQFLPGVELGDSNNLALKAQITTSSELSLNAIKSDGTAFRLTYSIAQLIPVKGKLSPIVVSVKADKDTSIDVHLRSSIKIGNYTPDRIDEIKTYQLKEGDNEITVDFNTEYEKNQYVFVCFMENKEVEIALSSELISGFITVANLINPDVSNYGKQTPPEGIGIDEFEFWCPLRRPQGKLIAMKFMEPLKVFGAENLLSPYQRPYKAINGWIPADEKGEVVLNWSEKQMINKIILYFDTDFDHAMENVQMGHHDAEMPHCLSNYSIIVNKDQIVEVKNNHQTINSIDINMNDVEELVVAVSNKDSHIKKALMGIYVE